MLGPNFSDYEDNYPRIAPSPTAVLTQQATAQPNSSVPEVSLIFTNNAHIPNNKPVIDLSHKYNQNISSYPGPNPPKSSVPELSIILPNNNETRDNSGFSNNAVQREFNFANENSAGHCSLPIRTFSMFKKEFVKKIASNTASSNGNVTSSNKLIKHAIESSSETSNKDDSSKNNTATTINDSEAEQNSTNTVDVTDENTKKKSDKSNESVHQCNCANSEQISKKIDNLSDVMYKMFDEIKEIQKEFESFKLEIKSNIVQSLTEVISKQLNLNENRKAAENNLKNNTEQYFKDHLNYGKEIQQKNTHNHTNSGEEFPQFSHTIQNCSKKPDNGDISVDVRLPKKQNSNGRAFKKPITHNILDPLPENSPLVITSDRSLVMHRLAEKYLPENYYNDVVNPQIKSNGNLEVIKDNKHVNELSFASYDYLRRYNLISDKNENVQSKTYENKNDGNIMFFENIEKAPKYM